MCTLDMHWKTTSGTFQYDIYLILSFKDDKTKHVVRISQDIRFSEISWICYADSQNVYEYGSSI